jgi:hypothetical protein
VSFSQKNIIALEILSDAPLSEGTLAYLDERAKNAFYDYVMTKFKEAEQLSNLTKAKLARRLNKKPDHISHVLGAPGNWTIGTITELLAGICQEEIVPRSLSFANRPPRNVQSTDLLEENTVKWGVNGTPAPTSTLPLPVPQWDAI